ncbi:MAG: phosphotransferase [Neisseriaceae bacterium]|nr:phosphotransferase [Neisseriaceae bacterium]
MMKMNQWVRPQHHNTDVAAVEVLTCAPPDVDLADAARVAKEAYGYEGTVQPLGGERDKNYLVQADGQAPMVLKFINSAETVAETDLQIAVLHWLAQQSHQVQMPQTLPTLEGADIFLFHKSHQLSRVRAYTFIEGDPVLGLPASTGLYRSFGDVAAQMVVALAGFDHPALARVLLWDVMHLMQLTDWLADIDLDEALKQDMAAFFGHFETQVWPQLQQLPQQVIHGDLSKSNTVVSAGDAGRIAGVLDFGDLCQAPRVVELAIAASYALDESDQAKQALQEVIAGYEAKVPLTVQERALVLDVVIARLIQRIVISKWRAKRFPDNQRYILRATDQAVALLKQFIQ